METEEKANPVSVIPFKKFDIQMGHWRIVKISHDGAAYRHVHVPKLTCIISDAVELDGKKWRHISLAHRNRLPSYDELVDAKMIFAGKEAYGIMPFVPEKEHINIHDNCLHIWIPIDHNPLPDFSRGSRSI